jgi:hypothetical protein
MKFYFSVAWVSVVNLGAGCAGTSTAPAVTEGNASLGITSFQVNESAEQTTIVGLGAQNNEVGRLELVHGHFMPSEGFLEDSQGKVVEGRKLSMAIQGHTFLWETMGYTDTTHMPAMPAAEAVLAAFAEDPHIRPLLRKWSIGWDGPAIEAINGSEAAYDFMDCISGTAAPRFCGSGSGVTCTIIPGVTTNACAIGVSSGAYIISRAGMYPSDVPWSSQQIAAFCCPTQAVYAYKACAVHGLCVVGGSVTGSCTGATECPGGSCQFQSTCGSDTNKCQMCASFSYSGSCTMFTSGNSICADYCETTGAFCVSSRDCCNGAACCDEGLGLTTCSAFRTCPGR